MTALQETTQTQASTAARAALVAAPLTLLVARLLMTPISKKSVDFMGDVHGHAGQTELGTAIAVVGAVLLIPALLRLGVVAAAGRARLAMAGTVLGIVGTAGLVMVATIQAIGARMSVQPQSRASLSAVFDQIYNAGAVPIVAQLAIVAGIAGSICLGVALFKTDSVPTGAAILTGLGGVVLFATDPGPAYAFIVGAAVIALAGFSWVAASDQD